MKGDPTNSTSIIVWSLKYCNWDGNTKPPTHIAKDGDPKHTAECNKTYNIANNIISNPINEEGEKKVNKQFKHCKNTEDTLDGMRACMGLS